jgi:hypothetical protein
MFDKVLRWTVFAACLALSIVGVCLILVDKVAGAALCFGASFVFLIFVYLARFKKFSGFGITGELWEDKQQEAAELIHKLNKMAFAHARPIVSLAAFIGRWSSGFTRRDRFKILEDVLESLKMNGAQPDDIAKARSDFDRMVAVDLIVPITSAIDKFFNAYDANLQADLAARFPPPITISAEYEAAVSRIHHAPVFRYPYDKRWRNYPESSEIEFLDAHIRMLAESGIDGISKLLAELSPLRDDAADWFIHRRLRRPEVYFIDPEP